MPVLLYYRGDLIKNSTGVGIVGARRCTDYGKSIVNKTASYLAKEGIILVSGMAKGIDGYTHTSTIRAGGYTVAVLGNGLDICYPPEHQDLMKKIIENGVLISEYPPGTKPNPKYFPRRNLIISAWSQKLLVIEAGEKSGSLITAVYAKKYGRELWVLPDNIYNRESRGSNRLIRKGAGIYIDKEDLLIDNRIKRTCDKPDPIRKAGSLDKLERQIIQVVKTETNSQVSLDELGQKIKLDQMELLSKLSFMELEGKVIIQGSIIRLPQNIKVPSNIM